VGSADSGGASSLVCGQQVGAAIWNSDSVTFRLSIVSMGDPRWATDFESDGFQSAKSTFSWTKVAGDAPTVTGTRTLSSDERTKLLATLKGLRLSMPGTCCTPDIDDRLVIVGTDGLARKCGTSVSCSPSPIATGTDELHKLLLSLAGI
jgi:hypothetical protein